MVTDNRLICNAIHCTNEKIDCPYAMDLFYSIYSTWTFDQFLITKMVDFTNLFKKNKQWFYTLTYFCIIANILETSRCLLNLECNPHDKIQRTPRNGKGRRNRHSMGGTNSVSSCGGMWFSWTPDSKLPKLNVYYYDRCIFVSPFPFLEEGNEWGIQYERERDGVGGRKVTSQQGDREGKKLWGRKRKGAERGQGFV